MNLPSAASPSTDISLTCPRCNETRSAPEGDRVPDCSCASLPPSERNDINVYELIDGHPQAFKFFAQAMPIGERPISAYADSKDRAVGQVKHLLDVGWKS